LTVSVVVRVTPPPVPVIVTVVALVTDVVVIANCAVVAPAGTVTLVGTEAAVFDLERVTTSPPSAAAADSVTVPVAPLPPTTFVGLTAMDDRVGAGDAAGFTVSAVVRDAPLYDAVIVTAVEVVTLLVVTVKVLLVAPAGTVTLAGTDAALELSESETTAPPLGAAALNVTVPVEELPPLTLVGLTVTLESATLGADGFTVIDENTNPVSIWAESWTEFRELGNVFTSKLALVAPAGTKTL
jgi:hypothetical protein